MVLHELVVSCCDIYFVVFIESGLTVSTFVVINPLVIAEGGWRTDCGRYRGHLWKLLVDNGRVSDASCTLKTSLEDSCLLYALSHVEISWIFGTS